MNNRTRIIALIVSGIMLLSIVGGMVVSLIYS